MEGNYATAPICDAVYSPERVVDGDGHVANDAMTIPDYLAIGTSGRAVVCTADTQRRNAKTLSSRRLVFAVPFLGSLVLI